MASNLYALHAVKINATTLTQVGNLAMTNELADHLISNGTGQPVFISTQTASPTFSFQTTELKRVLDLLATPWRGLKIEDGVESPVIMYLQKIDEFGARSVAAGSFITVTIANALIVPMTLPFSDGPAATITLQVIPIATSVETAPVVVATAQNDPSLTLTADEVFTAGPCRINAATISPTANVNVQNGSIEFGIQTEIIRGDGVIWPKQVSIVGQNPVARLTLTDHTPLSALGMAGTAQGADDSTIFLTKCTQDGARVARATAQHISFAFDAGRIHCPGFNSGAVNAMTSQLEIRPTFDGTNVIAAVNTATAIT